MCNTNKIALPDLPCLSEKEREGEFVQNVAMRQVSCLAGDTWTVCHWGQLEFASFGWRLEFTKQISSAVKPVRNCHNVALEVDACEERMEVAK